MDGVVVELCVCYIAWVWLMQVFVEEVVLETIVANDWGIEDVLVVCLSDDGWLDLDETLKFESWEFEYLLLLLLVLGIVHFDLFITRIVRRAGVI